MKGLHAGQALGRLAPAIHRKVELRNRPGNALAEHAQAQNSHRKIAAAARFAKRPLAALHVGLITFKFAKVPDDGVAHILRHLYRHARVVQANDR